MAHNSYLGIAALAGEEAHSAGALGDEIGRAHV